MLSGAEAAWIRENVWTVTMSRHYADVPAVYSKCHCQYEPCGWCSEDRHERCAYEAHNAPQWWKDSRRDVPSTFIVGARDNAYPDAEVRERGVVHEGRCSCWLAGLPGRCGGRCSWTCGMSLRGVGCCGVGAAW